MKLLAMHLVFLGIFGVSGLFYSQQQHSENSSTTVAGTGQTTPDKPANIPTSWSAQLDASLSFIENKGQFDGRNPLPNSKILYGIDNMPTQIFFTRQGVMYRFDKTEKKDERDEGWESHEEEEVIHESDFVTSTWIGTNPNVQVLSQEEVSHTYTYAVLKPGHSGEYELSGLKGYKKLVYKDLYPGIDVEYTLHPKGGIKYVLIVHPGADITRVSMQYPANRELYLDERGNIRVNTRFGDIIEHAPLTYYANNMQNTVSSEYVLNGNTISFDLGNYDKSQTIVIDPWVQSPTLGNAHCVWECDVDASGNVYVIGGDSPMKLQKYSSTGALQWTYNTPWDTTNNWLGTMATDDAGNTYVTSGSIAAMRRINTSDSMDWSQNGTNYDEYWTIAFNCDQTKMIVGGTYLGNLPPNTSHGVIFDINTSDGNVNGSTHVASTIERTISSPGPISFSDINEVRAISSSKNGMYYFLTLDTIGAINGSFSTNPTVPAFKENSTYNFAYKSEYFRPQNGNSGICAIKANDQFVYTQNGVTVHKRSLANGSILDSAAIPGGITTSLLFFSQTLNQPGNMGIDIDDCGYVYVGSGDRVVKYDANLNLIDSVTVPFHVYDVAVSTNGAVIVCGGTGNPTSPTRLGYVQSINMSACTAFAPVCCNPAILCPAAPLCVTSAPITLNVEQPGGVFYGHGITDANAGIFDPSIAGVGTHNIVYSLPCGATMVQTVEVISTNISLDILGNGLSSALFGTPTTLDADSGFASYLWSTGDTTQSITVTTSGTYSVTVSNSNGCVGTQTMHVSISNVAPFNGGNIDSFTGTTSGGITPSFYSNASPVFRENSTGIANGSTEAMIQVYPNPASNVVVVQLSTYYPATFKLYNLLGELVLSQAITQTTTPIAIDLPQGVYVYKVLADGQVLASNKFVVVK